MVEKKPTQQSKAEITTNPHRLYRSNDVLAVTVAPSDELQFFVEDNDRKKNKRMQPYANRKLQFLEYWRGIFRGWYITGIVSSYTMWLEISQQGRLHWHGIVTIAQPEEFAHMLAYYTYYRPGESIIDIDTINDMEIWKTYCTKDADLMKVKLADTDLLPSQQLKNPNIKPFKGFTPLGEI